MYAVYADFEISNNKRSRSDFLKLIWIFAHLIVSLQRNGRLHPTATSAAMAEERLCLCSDILQQQPAEAGILLAYTGGVCLVLSGF